MVTPQPTYVLSRVVFVMNILMWGLISVGSVCLHRLESDRVLFDIVLTVLLGIAAGVLCVLAKKNLLRIGCLFLFTAVYLSLMNFTPLIGPENGSQLIYLGIDAIFLTYWVVTIFSKGKPQMKWQARVLGIGFALLIGACLLATFCSPFDSMLILSTAWFVIPYGANLIAMCP